MARTVRVVPDGKAVPATRSGSLKPGEVTLPVSFPDIAVPGKTGTWVLLNEGVGD